MSFVSFYLFFSLLDGPLWLSWVSNPGIMIGLQIFANLTNYLKKHLLLHFERVFPLATILRSNVNVNTEQQICAENN